MAVSRATSFAGVTNPITGSARVSTIEIQRNPAVTATQYFAFWNTAAPTVGTTTPEGVWAIPPPPQAGTGQSTLKIVLPNGGHRCDTALAFTVTTTFNGATGSTTNAPLSVDVTYTPGG